MTRQRPEDYAIEMETDTPTKPMAIDPQIEPSWKKALAHEFTQDYFAKLKAFLLNEKQAGHQVYPPGKEIFNAFALTPFDKVKVVILGQDPYHGPNQAHGLAFSVKDGVRPPPSLKNIYKELQSDLGLTPPAHGNLEKWAKQGVFLLNTSLTVRAAEANSHRKQGWEVFTDAVIRTLSREREHVVFILWGSPAQSKRTLINANKHLILTSVHPSPLSANRGFFGCKHFSKTNAYLAETGQTPIDWQL